MFSTTQSLDCPSGWRGLELRFTGIVNADGESEAVSLVRYPLERLGGSAPVAVLRAVLVRDGVSWHEVDDAILDAVISDPPAFKFRRVGR